MGKGRKEVIMWQRMILLFKMPMGRRKQENMRIPPVHTMTLQSTMGNALMKSFPLMPPANSIICQIPFASNHSQTVSWPESAPSFSGAKLEQGCRSSLGAGVCDSRPMPIFMVHREMKMLTDLPQWLAWTSPGEAGRQQGGHVDLHDIIRVILRGRESTQLGYALGRNG